MKKQKVLIGFIFLSVLFSGCKPFFPTAKTKAFIVPKRFENKSDSVSIAQMNWREYFADESLIALIDTALTNNLDLSMMLQRIEVARNQFNYAKNLSLPAVTGNFNFGANKWSKYDKIENGDTDNTKLFSNNWLGVQSSWEIDIWGKLKNKRKAAFERFLASQEGKNWLITNLIGEIATNYYDLLAMDNELMIVRETSHLQRNALEIIKVQKAAGVANELAVQQFEAQLLSSNGLELEIVRKIHIVENRINFLLGRYPTAIPRNTLTFLSNAPASLQTGIPASMLNKRPDIRAAEHQLNATHADVEAARLAFYPSLNLGTNIGFQAFNPKYLFLPQAMTFQILGGLMAPIINRNAVKIDFATANAHQLEALYQYQKTILNAYLEVDNELRNLKLLDEILQLKSKEVDRMVAAIDVSGLLFKTGRASYLEVLMTQKSALQAKLELVSTKKEQFISFINIYRDLGGGWE